MNVGPLKRQSLQRVVNPQKVGLLATFYHVGEMGGGDPDHP